MAAGVAVVCGLTYWWLIPQRTDLTEFSDITMPTLSAEARDGATLFGKYCSACHGENGRGSDKGPPLIHKIYEPNHHGDQAFLLAVKQGVRSHHWGFGDMPPVAGINTGEVGRIVKFVREVQRNNGIN